MAREELTSNKVMSKKQHGYNHGYGWGFEEGYSQACFRGGYSATSEEATSDDFINRDATKEEVVPMEDTDEDDKLMQLSIFNMFRSKKKTFSSRIYKETKFLPTTEDLGLP